MRTFLFLFALSLFLRVGVLFFIPQDTIPPNPNWETGAVSISLATRGEFADPYLLPTGPTAHMPPLNVAAMGLIYRLLGVGFVGGLARWLLVMVVYSTLWALMPRMGATLGVGRKAGIIGGLAGAFYLTFPSELESYSALVLALLAMAFLFRWRNISGPGGSYRSSLLLGLALGVAFHLQPVFLPVVMGYMVFELWWCRSEKKWRLSGLMALGIFLACMPWGLRNYTTFHQLFFIRSNLGLELYVGNHEGAHADIDVSSARGSFRHPRTDQAEANRVLELGEGPYMLEKQKEAFDWILDNPGQFLELTLTRILYFWAGPLHRLSTAAPYLILTLLALFGAWQVLPAMDAPQRAVLLIPLATYPLIYYVVAYMPRYGEPVRWVLLLFAGAAVLSVPSILTREPPPRQPAATASEVGG
jgi:hypothetical protein